MVFDGVRSESFLQISSIFGMEALETCGFKQRKKLGINLFLQQFPKHFGCQWETTLTTSPIFQLIMACHPPVTMEVSNGQTPTDPSTIRDVFYAAGSLSFVVFFFLAFGPSQQHVQVIHFDGQQRCFLLYSFQPAIVTSKTMRVIGQRNHAAIT